MAERIERRRDDLGHSGALEAPQTSAADLEILFGAISEGLILYAADGSVTSANPAARAAFGLDRALVDSEALVRCLVMHRPNGRPVEPHELPSARALQGEIISDESFLFTDAAGQAHEILTSAAPVRVDGRIAGAITLWHHVADHDLLAEQHRQRVLLEHLVAEAPVGIAVVQGPDHRYVLVNPAYQAIPGSTATSMIGRTFADVFPTVAAEGALALLEEVYRTRAPVRIRAHQATVGPGRDTTFWNVDHVPLCDSTGQVEAVLILVQGVTEEVRTQQRLEFLAEASAALAASLDEQTALQTVIRLAVPNFADWCALDLLDEVGKLQRVTLTHGNPAKAELLRALWEHYPTHFHAADGTMQVVRARQSLLVSATPDAALHPDDDPALRSILAQLAPQSSLLVPLIVRDQVLGGMVFCMAESGRSYNQTDLQVAEELAHRVAVAIDNARLLRTAETERARLQAVLSQMPSGVIITEAPSGRILLFNERMVDIWRHPAPRNLVNDMYGPLQGFHPDGRPYLPAEWPLVRSIQTGEVVRQEEITIVRGDGTRGVVSSSSAPIRDAAGQIVAAALISLDITERKQAEAELHASHARLKTLSQRLINAQESERRRIARELHDEIGQVLTGMSLALTVGPRATPANVRARLAEAQRQINELTARVRALSLELRPAMLDDMGLLPALLWYVKRYTEQTQVQVCFRHRDLEQRFAPEIELTAYRLVQEALTNVARHADVKSVTMRVWTTDDQLILQIEDQGSGFAVAPTLRAYASSGLSSMRERAELLGGTLVIESAPGAGTSILAELPLADARQQHEEVV